MNKKQIKDLALSNGFKLKEQPSGEMDLNPYVYEFASALIAKANERVAELELSMGKLRTEILHACVEGSSSSGGIKKSAAHHLHHQALMIPPYTEQLRKEQE